MIKNYVDANKTEMMMLRKECGELENLFACWLFSVVLFQYSKHHALTSEIFLKRGLYPLCPPILTMPQEFETSNIPDYITSLILGASFSSISLSY